jgi:hypothetical protein
MLMGIASGSGALPPSGLLNVVEGVGPRHYSPSEVDLFLRCPMLWWLTRKRGWVSRVEPAWTPNRLVGSAVGAGLTILYGQYPDKGWPEKVSPESQEEAHRVLVEGWVDQDGWSLEALQRLVDRGLDVAVKGPQMEGVQSVVMAEQGVYGRRPDVILRFPDGLVVDDNKVAMALDAHQEPYRLAEYDHSWQLLDYAWHVGEYLAEPVTLTRLHLIVLGPRKHVTLHQVPVTRERLDRWYESAAGVWRTMEEMEQGSRAVWMGLTACTNKGLHFGQPRCPMYDACHVYNGNERAMEVGFERLPTQEGM